MTPRLGPSRCVELRTARESDLPAVLELLGRAHLPLLRSAAVDESWRGSGVGRVLVERVLDLARERGIEDIFLLTTTAEHYFPRFGFSCVSRDSVAAGVQSSIEFQEACPASATVMRKSLR